jgi:hypothetical protein
MAINVFSDDHHFLFEFARMMRELNFKRKARICLTLFFLAFLSFRSFLVYLFFIFDLFIRIIQKNFNSLFSNSFLKFYFKVGCLKSTKLEILSPQVLRLLIT